MEQEKQISADSSTLLNRKDLLESPLYDRGASSLATDSATASVLDALSAFAKTLLKYGISTRVCTPASLARLSTWTPSQKEELAGNFELWRSWIEAEVAEASVTTLEITAQRQKDLARRALDHYGLRVDESFWATVDKDDLIEIYGTNMVQLYRSFNFFKYCGFSLLEVSVFEWYNLWERPTIVYREMMRMAEEAMNKGVKLASYKVPRHILREKISGHPVEDEKRMACLVDFKFIASVYRDGEDLPAGAIVSSGGEIIARGGEVQSIQFL